MYAAKFFEVLNMKTKSIAMVLIILMSICLAACEDERNVPAYGTGVEEDTGIHHQIVTEPRYEVSEEVTQGADFMLVNAVIEQGSDGNEYLVLYTGVTNLTNEKKSPVELVSVGCCLPSETWLSYCRIPLSDYNEDDLYDISIKPGEQKLVVYAMLVPQYDNIDYISAQTEDMETQEIIFETNIYLETK